MLEFAKDYLSIQATSDGGGFCGVDCYFNSVFHEVIDIIMIIIQCGKIANSSCSPGYCCSIFGHCGQTPSHCGTDGCDPTYGVCGQVTTSNGLTSVMTTMTTTPLPTNSAQTIEASSTTPKTTSSDSSSTPTTNNSSGSFIKIHSGSLNGLFIIVMIAVLLL
ncbi:7384_t:CDS:2 [Entrophospora sp. SA101]|nr:7384_t:CDS:2 [Entrophospora sp. SA101]